MRVAVHTDFEYHAVDGEFYGEHAFTLFIIALAAHVDSLVLLGRVDPSAARPRYPLGRGVKFVGLPYYPSLARFRSSLRAMATALRRFWREVGSVDVVWLLGPHPVQLGFALLAVVRRKRVTIGVRQEFASYVASRHPRRPDLRLLALILEFAWRTLARFVGVVVVGPELADQYRHSRHLLEITASLVGAEDVVAPDEALSSSYEGDLRVLSVGRLEAEKNPLLLAEVLACLRESDDRWHLTVVGEGPLSGALAQRLEELGVDPAAELKGYVPFGPELQSLYRGSHLLLHVSWTEGLPQVLVEAFAAGLPAVATDVGGIRRAVGDAAVLIPPSDPDAAARSLRAVAGSPQLRDRLVRAGHAYVRDRTIEVESLRVAEFLAD